MPRKKCATVQNSHANCTMPTFYYCYFVWIWYRSIFGLFCYSNAYSSCIHISMFLKFSFGMCMRVTIYLFALVLFSNSIFIIWLTAFDINAYEMMMKLMTIAMMRLRPNSSILFISFWQRMYSRTLIFIQTVSMSSRACVHHHVRNWSRF